MSHVETRGHTPYDTPVKRLPTDLSTNPKSLPSREISVVRVALDVPLAKLFDYAAPEDCELAVGDRVAVPFGARQEIGVVIETNAASELSAERIKRVTALRDDAPRLPSDWLELMRFLSGYYQRPLGETIIASLPPRLRSVRPLPKKALAQPDAPASTRGTPARVGEGPCTRPAPAHGPTMGGPSSASTGPLLHQAAPRVRRNTGERCQHGHRPKGRRCRDSSSI